MASFLSFFLFQKRQGCKNLFILLRNYGEGKGKKQVPPWTRRLQGAGGAYGGGIAHGLIHAEGPTEREGLSVKVCYLVFLPFIPILNR